MLANKGQYCNHNKCPPIRAVKECIKIGSTVYVCLSRSFFSSVSVSCPSSLLNIDRLSKKLTAAWFKAVEPPTPPAFFLGKPKENCSQTQSQVVCEWEGKTFIIAASLWDLECGYDPREKRDEDRGREGRASLVEIIAERSFFTRPSSKVVEATRWFSLRASRIPGIPKCNFLHLMLSPVSGVLISISSFKGRLGPFPFMCWLPSRLLPITNGTHGRTDNRIYSIFGKILLPAFTWELFVVY